MKNSQPSLLRVSLWLYMCKVLYVDGRERTHQKTGFSGETVAPEGFNVLLRRESRRHFTITLLGIFTVLVAISGSTFGPLPAFLLEVDLRSLATLAPFE